MGVRKSVKLPQSLWDVWSNFLVVCVWKKKKKKAHLFCERMGLKLYCTSVAIISISKRSGWVGLNSVTWKHTGIVAAFVYSKSDNLLFQENKGSLCPQTNLFLRNWCEIFRPLMVNGAFQKYDKGKLSRLIDRKDDEKFPAQVKPAVQPIAFRK